MVTHVSKASWSSRDVAEGLLDCDPDVCYTQQKYPQNGPKMRIYVSPGVLIIFFWKHFVD